ncbi:MAG: hypothetical protein O2910_02140 [Proteobacteria bacterium]|nr:hypothetical protein [Pseudomonadota bacterium]
MNEMFLVVPVIIVTLLMAVGTVSMMAKFVRQRETISAVREEPEPEADVAVDEKYRMAA